MILDLSHLLDFQALAETGSFSRAAQARNMTQPGFSRRIRALEEWAGVPLFQRGVAPTGLTEAGRAFEPTVSHVLATLARGRDEARAAASRSGSALRFAATHVLSFSFFPAWLRSLDGGLPLEAIELSSDSLSACEDLMREGRVQFMLCHHHAATAIRLDRERFPSVRVGSDVLLGVTAPDEAGRPRHSSRGSGPLDAPLLAYGEASGLGRILATNLPDVFAGAASTALFSSHLAAALRSMAIMGTGVAWLPRSLVADDLAAGRLVRAAPRELDIEVDVHLFRSTLVASKAADRFWRGVVEALRSP